MCCITTSDGNSLPWASETRHLGTGTYVTAGRGFRCSVTNAKRSFHRAIHAVFGKVGRLASEEVTLQLAKSKCLPVLIYGLESFRYERPMLNLAILKTFISP